MDIQTVKTIAEIGAVAFLFYTHMIVIGRKLDKLADAVYNLAGTKKPPSDEWRKP